MPVARYNGRKIAKMTFIGKDSPVYIRGEKKMKKKTKNKKKVSEEEAAAPNGEDSAALKDAGKATPEANAVELETRLMRLQADFENFRKRVLREKSETYVRANEDIIGELLAVLDHFDLALRSAEEHAVEKAFLDGFRMVGGQMLDALGKFGLESLEAQGAQFDPEKHEAISHMPSDEEAEGIVITQTRKGYMLGQRLLRAAEVVVSSGPADGGK